MLFMQVEELDHLNIIHVTGTKGKVNKLCAHTCFWSHLISDVYEDHKGVNILIMMDF